MSALDKIYHKELRKNYYLLLDKLESIVGVAYYWQNQKFYVEACSLAQIEDLPVVPMFVKFTQSYSYKVEYKAVAIDSGFFARIAKDIKKDSQPFNQNINFNII